jgi:hypothetical protein
MSSEEKFLSVYLAKNAGKLAQGAQDMRNCIMTALEQFEDEAGRMPIEDRAVVFGWIAMTTYDPCTKFVPSTKNDVHQRLQKLTIG